MLLGRAAAATPIPARPMAVVEFHDTSTSEVNARRTTMMVRGSITAVAAALAAALTLTVGGARPPMRRSTPTGRASGRGSSSAGLPGQGSHDQTKPLGFGQQAPLTPEYQAVLEQSIADQAKGGLGNFPTARCLPAGMPHMMMAFGPQEYVITPETTYILLGWRRPLSSHLHRRTRLADATRADLSGLFDRPMDRPGRRRPLRRARGRDPRPVQRSARLRRSRPAAALRQSVDLQGADPSRQGRSEHPARRDHRDRPRLDAALDGRQDDTCATRIRARSGRNIIARESNVQIVIGKENYFLSADGFLMPAKKDQAPPDLRYFNRTQK